MNGATPQPSALVTDDDPAAVLPPGPRLPGLLTAALTLGAPGVLLPWCARRYGTPFTLRFEPHHRTIVVLADPESIREVFSGDAAVFHAGEGNQILEPILGGHSLLLQDDEEHHRARRLLMPVFGRREIAGYRALVAEVTARCLDEWPADGGIRAHRLLNALTLEVILRVVFGVTDDERLRRLRPVVTRAVDLGPLLMIGMSIPGLNGRGPWRRERQDLDELRVLLTGEIAEARRDPALAERRDLLARLVRASEADPDGFTDDEVHDQLLTMVAAGHETTATAVSWTLLELARPPELQDRCAAAAAADDDEGLLGAVLKESLRLHPVVPSVMRRLTAPATIGGRTYPAGTTLNPSIVLAHRDPARYPEPEEFRPERFLGETPAPSTWLPFGGGARRCIGASFAQMEGEEILRQVLRRYRLDPVGTGREWPRARNVTLFPWRRARLVLAPRGPEFTAAPPRGRSGDVRAH